MLKISLLLQISRANNSRILSIKNTISSGYCFHMNTNIKGDFQICISVPSSILSICSILRDIFFIKITVTLIPINLVTAPCSKDFSGYLRDIFL